MTAIRAFIARREKEIREQIKGLRAELDELKAVRRTLEPLQIEHDRGIQHAGPTIKDMVKEVLTKSPEGLSAQEILTAIDEEFGAKVERTSLSPQLSRLRQDGDVVLDNGRWFPSQSFLAGWTEAISDDEVLALIGPPKDQEKAATDQ